VLLEYGYALHCLTYERVIGIMNTAYGEPNWETLPFNLRHRTWPIRYHLAEGCETKKEVFDKLVEELARRIKECLGKPSVPTRSTADVFVPRRPSKKSRGVFWENQGDLTRDRHALPGAVAFLRVFPSHAIEPLGSQKQAKELAQAGHLKPFGRVEDGYYAERNQFGAAVVTLQRHDPLWHLSQLFLSREIWGVDSRILNKEDILTGRQVRPDTKFLYIANGYIEQHFVEALEEYRKFARTHLKIPEPLRFEAGLSGIRGYLLCAYSGRFMPEKSLDDDVVWQGEITHKTPAWDALEPFFKKIWENCDAERPAEYQQALAARFQRS